MFINKGCRTLDYNFIIWKFNTISLDEKKMKKLEEDANSPLEDNADDQTKKVNRNTRNCSIF